MAEDGAAMLAWDNRVMAAMCEYAGSDLIDNRTMVKMCKEAKLVGKKITTTDIDLAFVSHKTKSQTKMRPDEFVCACQSLCARSRDAWSVWANALCAVGRSGPQFNNVATAPGAHGASGPERFFYDKGTYTGAVAHPSSWAREGYADLSGLINREHVQDDALHRKRAHAGDAGRPTAALTSEDFKRASLGAQLLRSSMGLGGGQKPPSPKPYEAARPASPKWDPRGTERFLSGSQAHLAQRDTLQSHAAKHHQEAPKKHVTGEAHGATPLRGPERFFYDAKTYTGTHGRGGPDTHGRGGYSDLSGLTNRSVVQNDALHRKKDHRG